MNKKLQFWKGFYNYHKKAFVAIDWKDFRDNFIPLISVSSLFNIVADNYDYTSFELFVHESLKNFIKPNWRLVSATVMIRKELYYPFFIPSSCDEDFKTFRNFAYNLRETYISTLYQNADIIVKDSMRLDVCVPFSTYEEYLEELVK